jgi:hypothetical protein
LKSSGDERSPGFRIPAAVGSESTLAVAPFAQQTITAAPDNSPSAATQAADDELSRSPPSFSSSVDMDVRRERYVSL